MSSSSTLDSVWARQRDRSAADRGQPVSRYTAALNNMDQDLHTPSGESRLDSSNVVATLSLADLTSTTMDFRKNDYRNQPSVLRQSSPVAPYTPTRSWNAAIFNKNSTPVPMEQPRNTVGLAKQSEEHPAVASVPKGLNPYAAAWKPSQPLSSSTNETNSWEQHTPPAPPEAHDTTTTNNNNSNSNGNRRLEENAWETDPPAPQQSWYREDNQPTQRQAQKQQQWDMHDYRAPQEPERDTNKLPEQPADLWQRHRTPSWTPHSPQEVQTPQGVHKTVALQEATLRSQRSFEDEEILNQKIERIRISNQAYLKKREIIEAEKANEFQKETEKSAAGNNSFIDPDEEIRKEREANAARKLKAAQLRQWDAGKKW